MKQWIWRQLSIELPDDWELLQFTRNVDVGRCAFADRYSWRVELNWRVVTGPPDFERMVGDYRAKLEEEGMESTRVLVQGQWAGVVGLKDGVTTARYGAYLADAGCLLETVFIWPKRRDSRLEEEVLGTVHYVPAADGLVRWRAFGMDLRTPDMHFLRYGNVLPASAELTFRTKSKQREQCFGRKGMVKQWLKVPVSDWIQAWIPRGLAVHRQWSQDVRGHRIFRIAGTRRYPALKDFIWGRRDMDAAAWICPRDGRLYSVYDAGSHRARRKTDPRASLSCCSDLEVTL